MSFLHDNFNFKSFLSLNLVLFVNVKCEFEFENWFYAVSYLTIVLSRYYLSNELTIEIDFLNFHLRGCLYVRGDEITSRAKQ